MLSDLIVIAEVKTKSPTFKSERSWDELFEIASEVAIKTNGWVSIHTHPWFDGSFELIKEARKRLPNDVKILAKGFHFTDEELARAIEAGADWALVVNRIPKIYQDKCLIEPYFQDEYLQTPSKFKMVWNSRDLFALVNGLPPLEKESFDVIRAFRPDVWLCQASNVRTVADIHPKANAVLVGTHLEAFAKSLS